jgi:hypothetical protein
MPNTLAHMGVARLTSLALFRDAASLLGLALITILWFTAGWGKGKSPGILGPGVDRWRDYLPKNHGPH